MTTSETRQRYWFLIDDCTTTRSCIWDEKLEADNEEDAFDIAVREWQSLATNDQKDRNAFYVAYAGASEDDDDCVDFDDIIETRYIKHFDGTISTQGPQSDEESKMKATEVLIQDAKIKYYEERISFLHNAIEEVRNTFYDSQTKIKCSGSPDVDELLEESRKAFDDVFGKLDSILKDAYLDKQKYDEDHLPQAHAPFLF